MNLIGWIVAGGLAGWIVGVCCDDDDAALLVAILVGSFGALAGALLAPLVGGGARDASFDASFDPLALLLALCGALLLLGVTRCVRRALPSARRHETDAW